MSSSTGKVLNVFTTKKGVNYSARHLSESHVEFIREKGNRPLMIGSKNMNDLQCSLCQTKDAIKLHIVKEMTNDDTKNIYTSLCENMFCYCTKCEEVTPIAVWFSPVVTLLRFYAKYIIDKTSTAQHCAVNAAFEDKSNQSSIEELSTNDIDINEADVGSKVVVNEACCLLDTQCPQCDHCNPTKMHIMGINEKGFPIKIRCDECKKYEVNFERIVQDVIDPIVTLLRRHSPNGILCSQPDCGNDDPTQLDVLELDRHGFITRVKCIKCRNNKGMIQCGTVMSTRCHKKAKWRRVKISKETELKNGDHVTWHRLCGYWHHAIYFKEDVQDNHTFIEKLIHYHMNDRQDWCCPPGFCNGGCINKSSGCCQCCSIKENAWEKGSPINLYRIDYQDCYPDDYVVHRAKTLLKEQDSYRLCSNNCEHSSRWCKTGQRESNQVAILGSHFIRGFLIAAIRIIGVLSVVLIDVAIHHEGVSAIQTGESTNSGYELNATQSNYAMTPATDTSQPSQSQRCNFASNSNSESLETTLTMIFLVTAFFGATAYSLYVEYGEVRHFDCKGNCADCKRSRCQKYWGFVIRIVMRELIAASFTIGTTVGFQCAQELYIESRWLAGGIQIILLIFANILGLAVGVFVGRVFESACTTECCKRIRHCHETKKFNICP